MGMCLRHVLAAVLAPSWLGGTTRISAGGTHSCAVRSDGTGRCRGPSHGGLRSAGIRRISPSGEVSTLAGGTPAGYADGTGLGARFYLPTSIDVGPDGHVYVADSGNRRIRRISPDGVVTTVESNEGAVFDGVERVAIADDGTILFTDPASRIRKLEGGVVSTVAGSTTSGYRDGAGEIARFRAITGLSIHGEQIYVADNGASRLRRVAPDGKVSTVAGSSPGYADGVGAAARFSHLAGVTVAPSGIAYVADSGNNRRIRAVG